MNHALYKYLTAMTELFQRLPQSERQAYLEYERSDGYTRDSDWPGWAKYLGPRPMASSKQERAS